MNKFLCAVLLLASFAVHAENKYPYVNAVQIDENSSWKEIGDTDGYVVGSGPQFIFDRNRTVDGKQTCQMNGKLYVRLTQRHYTSPIPDDNSGERYPSLIPVSAPSTVSISFVAVPNVYQQVYYTGCPIVNNEPAAGFDRPELTKCVPHSRAVSQATPLSFSVPVYALIGGSGSEVPPTPELAFVKQWVVPACDAGSRSL